MPDYVSVREAAKLLGYHPETIRKMVRAKKLRADKKGTSWWVLRESVEAYKEAVAGKAKTDPTKGL
jgi:excisionase family DNA binding protein